jgi:hypothetical protein
LTVAGPGGSFRFAMRSSTILLSIAISLAGWCCRREESIDPIARGYVELVRAVARGEGSSSRARALLAEAGGIPPSARATHLKQQLDALAALLEIREGRHLSFDEESRLLFGVVAERPEEEESGRIRAELETLLEGEGPLIARYAAFQRRFIVPSDRTDAVLGRAIDETRRRTRAHLTLPPEESVRIELVSGKPWPSFCDYRGSYQSVLEINRDAPLTVASAVEIAGHEAYPGHHATGVLLERDLVRERGEVEFSVDPPVGPEALLREGLAQYGTELLFRDDEKLRFEKDVLFPLAGIPAEDAALYLRVEALVHRLAPFAVDGARQYVDGRRDRVASVIWLENEALVPDAWAFLRFVDRYRSYVLAYTLGDEMVRDALSRGTDDPWVVFSQMLSFSDDAT